MEIESVRLLQTRLDRIKKRHDELEPRPPADAEEFAAAPLTPIDETMPRSRSTITMVTESPRSASVAKAERLLGLGLGQEVEDGGKRIGKAANWLKKKRKGSLGGTPEIGGTRSPSIDGASPVLPYASPVLPQTSPNTKPFPSPVLASPSNEWISGGLSPSDSRKARPPSIITTSPVLPAPTSPDNFAFEFELPTASPRSDTFDPTPSASSPRRKSQPPSPRQPQSPHMSRSFSKRSSLLPPPTASALEAAISPEAMLPAESIQEEGYDPKLHAYAIRMLAELEDAQKEVSLPAGLDVRSRADGAGCSMLSGGQMVGLGGWTGRHLG